MAFREVNAARTSQRCDSGSRPRR
ncbi:hypothetical protein [Streptomyces sp. QTS52]